jgi:dimethylargininase
MSRLLVRRPSPRLAEGELTHLERVPVDPELAQRQWEAYVEVYRSLGWDVIDIEPDDAHADGVFVEDTVVMFGDLALLTRPGADSRRGEIDTTRAALERRDRVRRDRGTRNARRRRRAQGRPHGLRRADPAHERRGHPPDGRAARPARLDRRPRRGHQGAAPEERRHRAPRRHRDRLPPLVDDPSIYPQFLAVPEEHGTAVVVLDENTVLMSSDAPQSAQLFRDRGLTVIETPISEFEKLEGCVTCLSVRVRD